MDDEESEAFCWIALLTDRGANFHLFLGRSANNNTINVVDGARGGQPVISHRLSVNDLRFVFRGAESSIQSTMVGKLIDIDSYELPDSCVIRRELK